MVKTPAEKWKDTVIGYRKKCQKIIEVSKSVRYAGVINAYGRTLAGIVRSDVKPLLKSEQIKNEFFILSTLMNLRKDSENAVGKLNFVLLEHQKVSIIIFQKNGMTFYVSIDRKEKDINSIISKIKKLI
jgi:ABC-type microcin C transport system duplicated ATPase subunit YejF